ncbi:MAG: transglycosylase SLT domain-containing protein [Sphingopyxis sp.]
MNFATSARKTLSLCAALLAGVGGLAMATPAMATTDDAVIAIPQVQPLPATAAATPAIPLSGNPVRDAMASIRAGRWDVARAQISAIADRQLAAIVRAELFLAPNSPRVEGVELRALLNDAPTVPQASRIASLAQRRGVADLPALPGERRLGWAGSSPRRGNPRSVSDAALGGLPRAIQARITADDPAGAEAMLAEAETRLSAPALTEWRQRIAWSYYIENDDVGARRMAALAQNGAGEWVAQADWTQGLASWRQNDCRSAMAGFRSAAMRANESELVAAANFWFARAATACGAPAEAQPALRTAARLEETFYGILAAETLGLADNAGADDASAAARQRVAALPNIRSAMALANAGERALADQLVRHQARIGSAEDHAALAEIAGQMNLPETQLFLAHNAPSGVRPDRSARFPVPQWAPASGWRINPALVFAHTLQESQFRSNVVSPAGAVGLMQVRPGTANDMGLQSMGGDLTNPGVNMALGQSYIEHLRDNAATGGLLPKVIAAYNAGPAPVARWNSEIRDNGDPLLFIESIPYWETRAYVGTVLRNLWVYERQMGSASDSLAKLAAGQWPHVPGAPNVASRTDRSGNRARGGR